MTSRVLVVEDEPALARGLPAHFHDEGYEVRVVARGDQAVPAIRDFHPQLVVLDILLPGRSGLDVLGELRAAGDRAPVLMLTAKGEIVDRVVGLELGADDYLAKPFALRELLARVRALMRRAPLGPAAEPDEVARPGPLRPPWDDRPGTRRPPRADASRHPRLQGPGPAPRRGGAARRHRRGGVRARIRSHPAQGGQPRHGPAPRPRRRSPASALDPHRARPRIPPGARRRRLTCRRQG